MRTPLYRSRSSSRPDFFSPRSTWRICSARAAPWGCFCQDAGGDSRFRGRTFRVRRLPTPEQEGLQTTRAAVVVRNAGVAYAFDLLLVEVANMNRTGGRSTIVCYRACSSGYHRQRCPSLPSCAEQRQRWRRPPLGWLTVRLSHACSWGSAKGTIYLCTVRVLLIPYLYSYVGGLSVRT